MWVRLDLVPAGGARGAEAYAAGAPLAVHVCETRGAALEAFRAAEAAPAWALCAVLREAGGAPGLARVFQGGARRGRRAEPLMLFRKADGSVGCEAVASMALSVLDWGTDAARCEAAARDVRALRAAAEAVGGGGDKLEARYGRKARGRRASAEA